MKKHNFGRRLSVILVTMIMIIMVIMTGCTKDNSADPVETATKKVDVEATKAPEEETEPEIDTSKHVNLILYLWGGATEGEDAVMNALNEKLNAKINAEIENKYIGWGDIATKYPLLFASGEEYDMIFTSSTVSPSYYDVCSKGAFAPITDLLETYAPMAWENTPSEKWEDATYNGEIYGIPNRFSEYVPMGVIYRGDKLKEFGMDDIASIKDMETYFDNVISNRTDETYTPLLIESQSYSKIYDMFIAMNSTWIKAPGLEPNTLYLSATSSDAKSDIFSPVFTDEFMEFTKLMDSWEEKGYLAKDVLSNTEIGDTQWANEMGASYLHHFQGFAGGYGYFLDGLPESDPKYFCFGDINNKVQKIDSMQGATGFSITSKNVERALMAVDLSMNDQEIYRLWQYGIEGENYEIDENGVYQTNENYTPYGSTTWMFRTDEFELPKPTDWSGKVDATNHFNSFAISNPYAGFSWDSKNVEAEIAAINQVVLQYGMPLMFGKAEDVETAVEDLRARLTNAGIDKVIAEVKSQVDAYEATKQ